MAVTLAVGGATAPTSFSFTVSQVEDSSLPSTLVTSEFDFFIIIISYVEELSSFHLKEALWGFSVAHSNCQHHYSCLGSQDAGRKGDWTAASRYLDNQDGGGVPAGGAHAQRGDPARGWCTSRTVGSRTTQDSITAQNDGPKFKTYKLFICGTLHLIFSDHR